MTQALRDLDCLLRDGDPLCARKRILEPQPHIAQPRVALQDRQPVPDFLVLGDRQPFIEEALHQLPATASGGSRPI